MSPRRNFKTTGRWHKKSGEQNKAGINLKKITPSLPEMSQNTFVRLDQQEEKSIGASTQGVEENNKRYQENPQLYRTRRDKRTYIRL
jgi:hypothetical protein